MPEPIELRWSHAGLNCRDLEATEDFYRTWFGFERARSVQMGDDRVVFLRNGDAYLELFTASAEPAPSPTGDGPGEPGSIRHLAFQTDDVQAFLDRARGAVPVSLGPLEFDDFIPGWRTVWVTDPDGVVVEVSQGYRDEEQPAQHGH
ncbi:VOC family protein [Streptomyces sp. NBC_01136]|uniref:VOC family protein n=1 Tax=Streptomyces sp. NBC_01136 TaxID=2903754 RepID=UPI00386AB135|nr:VOC family protein [Streptomyces sp. NBC_01136]